MLTADSPSTAISAATGAETPRKIEIARAAMRAATAWQPIETAPKTGARLSSNGPIIALSSTTGHMAMGYWGIGIDITEGWINVHDHLRMRYGESLTHWLPLPEPPKEGA